MSSNISRVYSEKGGNDLESRKAHQNIIGNTSWLFVDKIMRLGVGLFVNVWLARYLKPELFGIYNYSLAFVSLFTAFATLGLDGIVVRNIVLNPSDKDEILGTAFFLKLIGGLIGCLAAMATILLIRPGDHVVCWFVGIGIAGSVFQAFDTIDFWFQSQVESKYTVIAKITAFTLTTVIKVILILVSAPLLAFAWVGLAEITLGSLALIITFRSNGHHITAWRATFYRAKSLMHDSWPLVLSDLMILVYMRIDQIMLGEMVGTQEVGIYSVAVRLVEVWYFLPMAIVSSTFPSVIEAWQVSEERFYGRLQKLYNIMAISAYVVAIPVSFMASFLVNILFGDDFHRAGPMLAVLIWSVLFTNLGVARSSFLTAMNWTRLHFVTVALGCLINIVLNYFLIPIYGGMGAVIASCIAYWFAAYGACFVCKPLFNTGNMLTKALIYPRIW